MMRWCLLLLMGCGLPAALGLAVDGPLLDEVPPPDGPWRPHLLARCGRHASAVGAFGDFFQEARELFLVRTGGDASILLEMAIGELGEHPWLNLMLAQIYILAGQGEPHCVPTSGPLAPAGDWGRDRLRLLERGMDLLEGLSLAWTDDGIVDFLKADAARARGDHASAAEHDFRGRQKCSHTESLDLLAMMRDLRRRPAELLELPEPVYPPSAARRRAQGVVVFDLLIDPFGRVAAVHQVGRTDPALAAAAREAVLGGGYQAARVAYYPVWSWLRIPIHFVIGD